MQQLKLVAHVITGVKADDRVIKSWQVWFIGLSQISACG